MNKKFLLVFICIISLLTLASCHNKFEEIKEELPAKQEENLPIENISEVSEKEIIIPFPEDFTFGYTEPEITPPEDFEWGEYMPFVRYSIGSYGEVGIPLYTYAFLGNGINNLDEGHTLYEKLNDKYKKTFEYSLDDTVDWFPLSVQEEAIPLVSESRVIWVSTDANEIGNYYLEKVSSSYSENMGWDVTVWNGHYEIYENEKLISSDVFENTHSYQDGGVLRNYIGKYSANDVSSSDQKFSYKLLFDFDTSQLDRYYTVNQIIDGRYLVLTFYSDMFKEEKCHNIYLFDLETEEMTKINGYCFNPLLSPDRKYLIYSQETWQNTEVNSRNNYDYDLKHGFYIKNLENGETTFYDYNSVEYAKSTQSINWVKEENLKELIYGEKSLSADTEILLSGDTVSLGEMLFHSSGKNLSDADLSVAYLDMDGDGEEETLLRDSLGDTLIIFSDNSAKYFSFRAMYNIKTDGSYCFNGNASRINGEARLTRDGEKELSRVEEDEEEIKFFLEGKEVTADEFYEYDKGRELTLLEFSPFEIS